MAVARGEDDEEGTLAPRFDVGLSLTPARCEDVIRGKWQSSQGEHGNANIVVEDEDLEEMGTALAFQLPGGCEAAGPTSSLSLVTTVVVLDIAQNCFKCEDNLASQGEF